MTDTSPTKPIPNNKIKEYQKDLNSWKKILNSRMEENVLMKNKLGDLLKKNYNKNHLEQIEEFQNKFLREDEVTDMLRNDVIKFDDLLSSQGFKDDKLGESCEKRMKKLRAELVQSENYFCSLTASFDDFAFEITS